jgi:hypothetical protein
MNKQDAFLSALGGHVVDLVRLLAFDVKNPHSLSKLRNIDAVRRKTGARTMIETGTFLGVTAARAARIFEKVVTVELDPTLAEKARAYLRRFSHVEVITGDALAELPKILERSDMRDVVVFLDGHFSGGVTAHGDIPEPAVLEIDVLARFRDKLCGIVVDDFRCFGTESGWPTKAELVASIERHFNDDFDITIHLDQVLVTRRRART